MATTREPIALFSDGTPVPFDGNYHVDPLNPMTSVRCIEPWVPPGVIRVLSGGNTASLGLLPDNSVLKFPWDRHDRFSKKALDIEDCILLALGDHKRIVKYLGKEEYGLRFQLAVNGDVRRYMSTVDTAGIPLQLRFKWSLQATEGLAFVHARNVVHCDIHPNNLLLDDQLDLRLCDFSGSLFGDLDGAAMESTRFFLPRDPLTTPNVKTDLFALGSTIYYIMLGREPYDTLSEDEVSACYARGDFPEVESVPCGLVIMGCWKGHFDSAEEVIKALSEERKVASPL